MNPTNPDPAALPGEEENGGPGYDCSSATSYVLWGGGFGARPRRSKSRRSNWRCCGESNARASRPARRSRKSEAKLELLGLIDDGIFAGKKSFFTIEVQRQRLILYLNLDPASVQPWDESRKCDATKIGHFGMGNTECSLRQAGDLDGARALIKLAYAKTS